MKERLFRFKKFSVRHDKSAMKVGVDGVLIGAWASPEGNKILDVGTGCGLIALMLAQRNEKAHIDAIDIDMPSLEEARVNVVSSPWADRISIYECSFDQLDYFFTEKKYDLIVSNPPFFDSGIENPSTSREKARHQGGLSPKKLVCKGRQLLNPGGRLALICPVEMKGNLLIAGEESGLLPKRICYVKDNENSKTKRVMIEYSIGESYEKDLPEEEILVMLDNSGNPTPKYRNLCKEFYLRF